jgi:hypothetical protein
VWAVGYSSYNTPSGSIYQTLILYNPTG